MSNCVTKLFQERAKILRLNQAGTDLYRIALHSPRIAASAWPGQIVAVRVSDSLVPLLRRPFAIFDANPATGTVELLFQVVGLGTEILSKRAIGEEIDLVGPSGNGFPLPEEDVLPLAVAGGIGLAPIHFLCSNLLASGREPELFYGAPTAGRLAAMSFPQNLPVHIATDDGTAGEKGFVTDLLRRLDPKKTGGRYVVYACGPNPMLRACSRIAEEKGWACHVSLEQRMACGLGACGGCVVDVRISDKTRRLRVCKEGPVFNAEQILWT